MKRLLTSTTALSLALMPLQPMPLLSQVLAEDGRILAADGTVLCEPTADLACDIENPDYIEAARVIQERMDADAAAAAEAQAAADAAAALAAQAQAAADAATQADAKAAQEAAAAAQAEADAAAASAVAATDAAAAAQADAATTAEAEAEAAAAAALATAAAEADAAAAAAQADTIPVAEPQTPAEVQAQTDAALAEAATEITAPDGTFIDPSAGLAVMETVIDPDAPLVDAPVISDAETQALTTLLAAPADPAADAPAPEVAAPADAPVPALTEAAAADPVATAAALTEIPLTDGAVAATVATIAPEAVRTSAQEFAAAPQTTADGKKTGLSGLEKVGLFVLGAVVVGQILKANADKNDGAQQVVSNTGDRVVVLNPDGSYGLYKDDDAILRQAGSTVRTETYEDGSSRTIVQRVDGTQVVTVRNATGRVLRRAQYDRLGRELVLLDDFAPEVAIDVATLPAPRVSVSTRSDDAALRAALAAREIAKLNRSFSLRQIREIAQVRALAAEVDVERVTFPSGSAAISTEQANALADLGAVMQDLLDANPAEMFLIEGHTDATGAAAMNLALSDRRAESVALALSEYFGIPPENMIVQGYGETELRINTQTSEALNRRVSVRIITPLLR